MCGILGVVGTRDARRFLHEGLTRLEYRGYDSAGVAVANCKRIEVAKAVGRVAALDPDQLPTSSFGIAHTRWATHGGPTVANAHPHLSCDGRIAVAHNGILENHDALRAELRARGHTFVSETDTEVVPHLLEEVYEGDITEALARVVKRLEGSFALLAMHVDEPDVVAAARQESPLVLGVGDGVTYVASDIVAFRPQTDLVIFLEDGDVARLTPAGPEVRTAMPREIAPEQVRWSVEEATLAGFPHFMLKEVHDQPRTLHEALLGRTSPGRLAIEGSMALADIAASSSLSFIACGSSYNAAAAAAPLFEAFAGLPTRVTLASEYTATPVGSDRPLVVAVTQSGETADTLAAMRAAREHGHTTLAVANVVGSTATRSAHAWLPIHAGPEVSVAATKSFTSQLAVLHALALQLGAARRGVDAPGLADALEALCDVPTAARATLAEAERTEPYGRWLAEHDHAFVLGRQVLHPVALETALKIKEVSYVHAEGLAAGELKHGPLALIEEGTPVLAYVPRGPTLQAMLSNMREVAARGGRVVAITDDPQAVEETGFEALAVPACRPGAFPYQGAIMGQLLAYHAALARGCDVDRPRNLAKSVTVG